MYQSKVGKLCNKMLCNKMWFFVTLWTVARQTPLFMEFSRQKCWSGLPCPPPGDPPNPGIRTSSLMSPALAGGFFTTSATWEEPAAAAAKSLSVVSDSV